MISKMLHKIHFILQSSQMTVTTKWKNLKLEVEVASLDDLAQNPGPAVPQGSCLKSRQLPTLKRYYILYAKI